MFKKLTATAACVVVAAAALSTEAIAAGNGSKVAQGRTAQGRKIHLKVMPDAVKILRFSIELHCSGGYILIDQESNFLASAVSRKGRIHDAQVGTTDEILIRGNLTGSKVTGRLRVRDRLGKHRCSSPWVKFHAKAG